MPNQVSPPSTKSMSVPSQSSTLLATAPTVGSVRSTSTAARTQSGCGLASLFRNASTVPVADSTPRLHPPAKPRLVGDSTTVAEGTAARIRAALPSPDALSTTTTCSLSAG
jgi:hypothetical protein